MGGVVIVTLEELFRGFRTSKSCLRPSTSIVGYWTTFWMFMLEFKQVRVPQGWPTIKMSLTILFNKAL